MIASYQVVLPLFVVALVVLTLPLTFRLQSFGILGIAWGTLLWTATREPLSASGRLVLGAGTVVIVLVELLYLLTAALLMFD